MISGPDASLGAVDGEPGAARDILIVGCEGPVCPGAVPVSPTTSSASIVTPSPSPYVGTLATLALKPTHILHVERDTKQKMKCVYQWLPHIERLCLFLSVLWSPGYLPRSNVLLLRFGDPHSAKFRLLISCWFTILSPSLKFMLVLICLQSRPVNHDVVHPLVCYSVRPSVSNVEYRNTDDRMTEWWDNGMSGWQEDIKTGNMTWWQEALQTIDRMVYFVLADSCLCVSYPTLACADNSTILEHSAVLPTHNVFCITKRWSETKNKSINACSFLFFMLMFTWQCMSWDRRYPSSQWVWLSLPPPQASGHGTGGSCNTKDNKREGAPSWLKS